MVEGALTEMEGSGKGAAFGGIGLGRRAGATTLVSLMASLTQFEVPESSFKGLLNPKDRAANHGTSAMSPGVEAGKSRPAGPRTSDLTSDGAGASGASASGTSQTDIAAYNSGSYLIRALTILFITKVISLMSMHDDCSTVLCARAHLPSILMT